VAAAAIYAQQQVEDPGVVFRADTRLVVCHTSVFDKTGHLVTGLPKSAFSVTENGAPQEIKIFKAEDVPVARWAW
jgi:Ca-activated chloride channel family protein